MIKLEPSQKITKWAAKLKLSSTVHYVLGDDFIADVDVKSNGYQHTNIDIYVEGDRKDDGFDCLSYNEMKSMIQIKVDKSNVIDFDNSLCEFLKLVGDEEAIKVHTLVESIWPKAVDYERDTDEYGKS